jgi:hypothetical protein
VSSAPGPRPGAFRLQPLRATIGTELPQLKDVPPLDVALRERFGTRLQPQRGPVDVMVIASVQPPTPN